jgi:membrane protein implicated in regulation of membrane protease activity
MRQVFYFLNRYCLLFALIGITIALNVTTQLNCQVLYTFNQTMGNMAIGLASINLSLRTMAVWSQKWFIVVPIVALILGHWSLLLHGILLKAEWVPGEGCVITSTDNTILSATFIYSMCFDFVVLCLTGYRLYFPSRGRSRLVTLIFADGLLFFIVAFLANSTAVVFILLNLNPIMSVIANVPACVVSTTVACRAVRRLANFTSGVEVYGSTSNGSTLGIRSNTKSNSRPVIAITNKTNAVRVEMETIQKTDDSINGSVFHPQNEGVDADAKPFAF